MNELHPSVINVAISYTATKVDSNSLFVLGASCSVADLHYSFLFLLKSGSLFLLFDVGTGSDWAWSSRFGLCTVAFRGVSAAIASPIINIIVAGFAFALVRFNKPGSDLARAANSSCRLFQVVVQRFRCFAFVYCNCLCFLRPGMNSQALSSDWSINSWNSNCCCLLIWSSDNSSKPFNYWCNKVPANWSLAWLMP